MNFESFGVKQEVENIEDKYVDELVHNAFSIIENQRGEDYFEFHNTDHSKTIINRSERILNIIQEANPGLVKERDYKLAKISGAYHDIVQDYNFELNNEDGSMVRKRFIGDNEEKSAEQAINFIYQIDKENIFNNNDKEIIKEAINNTVPSFDLENNTVIQDNLNKDSSIVARVIALSDIGGAGMDGAEQFIKEGSDLFREENVDIFKDIEDIDNIPEEKKKNIITRIIKWSEFQPKFAEGRKNLLDKELEGLPEESIEAIKNKLFNKFDESIEVSKEKAELRKKMDFKELIKDMGYN